MNQLDVCRIGIEREPAMAFAGRGLSWGNALAGAALLCVALCLAGCQVKEKAKPGGKKADGSSAQGEAPLEGTIHIDGSSTVAPISRAAAEEFGKVYPQVHVLVGTSGTGGGFKKFCIGETDINDASRPIKPSEEDACREHGIESIELKIAIDGLSVVVNPENDWCDCLSVAQLRRLWQQGSDVQRWSDLDPNWPDEKILLYGPDTASGTFDYFTEEICGKSGNSRADYTSSADDNVLVTGVAGDKYSLGYFGYAYYAENDDKLKAVGVSQQEDGSDCVKPTPETVEAGKYAPLSRPLFLYVKKSALARPEVVAFLRFYLDEGQSLVREVGYVGLGAPSLEEQRQKLDKAVKD